LAKFTPITIVLTSSTKFGKVSSSELPLPSSRCISSLNAFFLLSQTPSSSELKAYDEPKHTEQ